MSSGRVWLVHGLLASILSLTAISFVRREPFWPVSHYPMFSQLRVRADATSLEVYVVSGGQERRLARERGTFFRDFDATSVQAVLAGIDATDGAASERSRRFLALLLDAMQRDARRRDDEVPEALRLYRVDWRFADERDPRRQPAERTLLATAGEDAASR